MIAASTIALTLSLCGAAVAAPMPTQVTSDAVSAQSGAAAERASSAALSPRADADASAPAVSSEGGLGVLAIVLISVGGAVALGAAAYTTKRFVHHPHPVG